MSLPYRKSPNKARDKFHQSMIDARQNPKYAVSVLLASEKTGLWVVKSSKYLFNIHSYR